MIDIGGPALLRAAAKNFVDVVPVCDASRYGEILAELARGRRPARHPPQAGRRGVRPHRRLRDIDRGVVRRRRDLSAEAAPLARAGAGARLRREPAPAGRLLRGSGRAAPPPLPGRPPRGEGALVQQPQRPGRRAGRAPGVHAPGLRRSSSMRTRAGSRVGGDDRGGLREGARVRSRLGLRRHRRAEPQGPARARRAARRAVRRGADRARLRRRRARRAAAKEALRILRDRERRGASPGDRDYRRVLGGFLVQDTDAEVDDREGMKVVTKEHPDEPDVGRPPVRLARREARRLECDRDREGPAGDRHRRRPDEPGRRRPPRAREGAPSTGTTSTGAVLASDAFFPFPDGPQLALDAGVIDDRPARRLEARRRGRRRRRGGRCRHGLQPAPTLPALR